LGESQNGGDNKCNFWPFISEPAEKTSSNSTNSNNSNNSNNPAPGNSTSVKSNMPSGGSRANHKQHRGVQRKSTKAERQTSNALAAAAETTQPTLYHIYMATCSESKRKSTAVQWALLYRRAYLGDSSYHMHQHSPSPCPGDDVCQGQPKANSPGSVLERDKLVDESEVLVVPMLVYDRVLGLPW